MILNEMNEDISKKIADKGWANMQQLLDKEMPVQEKRRRLIWWWWLLPALLVGALYIAPAGHVPGTGTPAPSPQPVQQRPSPLPMAAQSAPAADVSASVNEVHVPPSAAETGPLQSRHSTEKSVSAQVDRILDLHMSEITPPTANESTPLQVSDLMNAAPETPIQVPEQTSPQFTTIETIPVLYPGLVHSADARTTEMTLNELPIPAPSKEPTLTVHASHRWQAGIGTAASSDDWNAPNGVSGGINGWYHLNRRWGIQAGLHYAVYNWPANNTQLVAIINTGDYQTIIDSSQFALKDAAGNIINAPPNVTPDAYFPIDIAVPISKVKAWEMPFLMSFRVLKRWNLYGGGRVSRYRYTVKSEKNYDSAGAFNIEAKTETAIQTLNSAVASSSKHWFFDLQLGTGVGLGKHLEVTGFVRLPSEKLRTGADQPITSPLLDFYKSASIVGKGNRNTTLLLGLNYWF